MGDEPGGARCPWHGHPVPAMAGTPPHPSAALDFPWSRKGKLSAAGSHQDNGEEFGCWPSQRGSGFPAVLLPLVGFPHWHRGGAAPLSTKSPPSSFLSPQNPNLHQIQGPLLGNGRKASKVLWYKSVSCKKKRGKKKDGGNQISTVLKLFFKHLNFKLGIYKWAIKV